VQFFASVRAIIEDIKHSWYFRVYGFFWIFFAIFTFAVLIVLGQQSTEAQNEPTFHFWRENATRINFPRFHFRINNLVDTFNQSVVCTFNGQTLATVPCDTWKGHNHPITRCQAVSAENVIAENQARFNFDERRIFCRFATNYQSGVTDNLLVSFELEGQNIANFGANAYSSVWIAPNNNTWILLDKAYITFWGQPELEEWDRELVYHSTISQPGFYQVSIIINRFWIVHGEQSDRYTGWMALGEIGGFGYFLLLLHALVMIVTGVCLNNDAKFLSGDVHAVSSDSTKEERAAML